MAAKITIRKYQGDDACSWAIFKDGKPVMTGLDRTSAIYYKGKVKERVQQKRTAVRGPDPALRIED